MQIKKRYWKNLNNSQQRIFNMAINVLIMGRSGSGKSSSIENLPEKETVIVNTAMKDLPWRGWRKKFNQASKNIIEKDNIKEVKDAIIYVDKNMPDVKYIIIDDFQYLMAHHYMRNAMAMGWDVFKQMGQDIFELLWQTKLCRRDLIIYFMAHTEETDQGKVKCKTSGKMLDQHITMEGEFTIVLMSDTDGTDYWFETKTNGVTPAKTPRGMFDTARIPNDLLNVSKAIKTYYEGE